MEFEDKIKRQWDRENECYLQCNLRQELREQKSVEDGKKKYWEGSRRIVNEHEEDERYEETGDNRADLLTKGEFDPMKSKPEFMAICKHVEVLAAALREEFPADRALFSKKHRVWAAELKAQVMTIFAEVTFEEAAFLTLKYAIRCMFVNEKKTNYASVCRPFTDELLSQYHYKIFRREFPAYVDTIIENRRGDDPDFLHSVLTKKRHDKGIGDMNMDDKAKVLIGGLILHHLCASTGLFEFVDVFDFDKKRTTKTLAATSAFMDWLDTKHNILQYLMPVDVPMVCTPQPWTDTYTGGFLSNNVRIKRHSILRARQKDLRETGYDRVSLQNINALQALQEVPWKINGQILDTLTVIAKAQSGLGGVPLVPQDLRLPPEPWHAEGMEPDVFKQEQPEAYKAWRIARTVEYTRFHNESSVRTVFRTIMAVADEYRDEPEFFFCYNMDWRGRVYVLQNCGLNPQGDDIAKSLLLFSEGKKLGPQGMFWLGVHLANSFGFDKASFQDRFEWAKEHHEDIIATGKNPLDVKWWADADKPFMFLAACMEWAQAWDLDDPTEFVSHLPIGMDASCSGSQHFSGLLRDPVGGKAVNLVPSGVPSDIYALVAAESMKIMLEEQTEEAYAWMKVEGGFNRKWTKRNTMTMPYSASLYGFTDQLLEELLKEHRKHGKPVLPVPKDVLQGKWDFQCSRYLAETNRKAISKVVVKMFAAMEWFREVAEIVAKSGRDITWTTPVGLKVIQRYHKSTTKRINLWFGEVRYNPVITEETNKPNVEGHRNGISPNFIHSMDAAHLMKIAEVFTGQHGKSLGVVHDSFSTHACDVELMRGVVRKTFADMYAETNWIGKFYVDLKAANPDLEIPPPPEQGDLDVRMVEESDYFIS